MKRARSYWGYEIRACQSCGVASVFDPCRLCRKEQRDRATVLEASTLWGGLDREMETP